MKKKQPPIADGAIYSNYVTIEDRDYFILAIPVRHRDEEIDEDLAVEYDDEVSH